MIVKKKKKLSGLVIKRWCNSQQLKGTQCSIQVRQKGYHLLTKGIRKEYLLCQKWYIKGQGIGPQERALLV